MKLSAMPIGVLAALALASATAAQTAEPAPNPAALEAAKHLMRTMHLDQQIDQAATFAEKPGMAAITFWIKQLPEDKQKMAGIFLMLEQESRKTWVKDGIESISVEYATYFTQQQIIDIDQFYQTPAGQAELAERPKLNAYFRTEIQSRITGYTKQMVDRFCAKISCTDDDRIRFVRGLDAARLSGEAVPD